MGGGNMPWVFLDKTNPPPFGSGWGWVGGSDDPTKQRVEELNIRREVIFWKHEETI